MSENPNINNNNIQNNSNTSYKDLLEQKIRNQAKRLCELQEYKNLCEKRILQIFPGHPLPINEIHIQNNFKISEFPINQNEYNYNEKVKINTDNKYNLNLKDKVFHFILFYFLRNKAKLFWINCTTLKMKTFFLIQK